MKTKRRNPSLPHILCTGAILIALELHIAWELSTPRERGALAVAALGEVRALASVAARVGVPVSGVGGLR